MGDINDWAAFVRGRWDWTKGGYERGFPRGCQFTDVDAAVEFDGRSLVMEAKHWDGQGPIPRLSEGQRLFLLDEVRRGKTALVVFGCGSCNDPWAVRSMNTGKLHDWRDIITKEERRLRLKLLIDQAMGLRSGLEAA